MKVRTSTYYLIPESLCWHPALKLIPELFPLLLQIGDGLPAFGDQFFADCYGIFEPLAHGLPIVLVPRVLWNLKGAVRKRSRIVTRVEG